MGSSSKHTGRQTDGNFTLRMIDYIKANFAEILGPDVDLLDTPNGLELLRTKYMQRYQKQARKAA